MIPYMKFKNKHKQSKVLKVMTAVTLAGGGWMLPEGEHRGSRASKTVQVTCLLIQVLVT